MARRLQDRGPGGRRLRRHLRPRLRRRPAQLRHPGQDDVQPEYTKPIWAYLDTAVSPEHVATGRQQLADNKAALRKATKPYGVAPQIVVAIWGLESAYGVNTGGYNVIEALATMAYGSGRPDVLPPEPDRRAA